MQEKDDFFLCNILIRFQQQNFWGLKKKNLNWEELPKYEPSKLIRIEFMPQKLCISKGQFLLILFWIIYRCLWDLTHSSIIQE